MGDLTRYPDGIELDDDGDMLTVFGPDGIVCHVHPDAEESLVTWRQGKDSDHPRGVLLALAEAFRLAAERAVLRG